MNHRSIVHGLAIALAIAMLVAAFAYRAEVPSSRGAIPPEVQSRAADLKLGIPDEKNSAQLQQERLTRLQSRL